MKSKKRRIRFEVKYQVDPEDETTWLTLEEVRKKIEPGKWSHNRILEEVDAALNLQKMPSEFWQSARQDQAYILAHKRVKSTMTAFEEYLREKK
jgi:hypothetical protein